MGHNLTEGDRNLLNRLVRPVVEKAHGIPLPTKYVTSDRIQLPSKPGLHQLDEADGLDANWNIDAAALARLEQCGLVESQPLQGSQSGDLYWNITGAGALELGYELIYKTDKA